MQTDADWQVLIEKISLPFQSAAIEGEPVQYNLNRISSGDAGA
jgi:hypothetical protein